MILSPPSTPASLQSCYHLTSVVHSICWTCLLQRATELFGLNDNVINWLKSYLKDRTSFVSLGNCQSTTVCCATGVPLGSVLGPLLFSIFTTPVGRLISGFNISYHQYADDTQLYTSVDSSSSADIARLSSCAEAVTKWHLENCLLLNPSKTELLVTGTRQQVTKFQNATAEAPAFQFAGNSVSRSNSIRVLGVTIDQHLTFDSHVSKVVQSCNYHIRGLRYVRQLIDKDMANTLSCSIVSSRLDYCNALLYGMTQKNFNSLQRVQNSLARVVCNAPYRSPPQPLLKSLHWLPVIERVEYKLAAMTYKVLLHQEPSYLLQHIDQYKPVRTLRSSNSTLLNVPPTKTITAARAFRISAPTVWNSLPSEVRESSSQPQFLRRLKGHLFQRVFC
jgi:hypothetical protein